MVREQPKEHGKETLIDGYVPTRADRVSLVDDVVTTGRSFEHMIKVLKPTGAEILGCHAIVKRGESCVPMTYFFVPGDLA
jgi:orotate phosphoribosyltransferase